MSSSGSSGSQIRSASKSSGYELASSGSVPQFGSSRSDQESPSSSVSALLPVPSKSRSSHSVASNGNMSYVSSIPSPSSSGSTRSQMWSPSKSSGTLKEEYGSVWQSVSSESDQPSLSSSRSALSPTPSPSLSSHSVLSSGKASPMSGTESPSSSPSALSPMPSPSVSTHSPASRGKASVTSA